MPKLAADLDAGRLRRVLNCVCSLLLPNGATATSTMHPVAHARGNTRPGQKPRSVQKTPLSPRRKTKARTGSEVVARFRTRRFGSARAYFADQRLVLSRLSDLCSSSLCKNARVLLASMTREVSRSTPGTRTHFMRRIKSVDGAARSLATRAGGRHFIPCAHPGLCSPICPPSRFQLGEQPASCASASTPCANSLDANIRASYTRHRPRQRR